MSSRCITKKKLYLSKVSKPSIQTGKIDHAIDFLEFQLDFRPFSSMEGRVTPVSVRSWKIRIPSHRGGTLKKRVKHVHWLQRVHFLIWHHFLDAHTVIYSLCLFMYVCSCLISFCPFVFIIVYG